MGERAGWASQASQLPLSPLPFRSTVAASADDPYGSLERVRHFARAWGGRLVETGKAGRINCASGLGAWPDGRRQLEVPLQESQSGSHLDGTASSRRCRA